MKGVRSIIGLFFVLFFCTGNITGQEKIEPFSEHNVVRGKVVDGDTIYMAHIDEVYIFPRRYNNWWQMRRYYRLVYNVKKAYPWAKLAGKRLKEINDHLVRLPTEKARKKYIKKMEEELMEEFEDDLKKLTITQGRILIKLIDRETGDTSYELVKELKGSFPAFFWQAVAHIFGSNLKATYDARGEDRIIEEIIIMIENGQI